MKTKFESKTSNESGMVTVSYVLATGLSLLVMTWCMVFVVASYTRAVIRDSASRASREGVVDYNLNKDVSSAVSSCEHRFNEDLNAGLPTSTHSGLTANCSISNGKVIVRTTGSLKHIGGLLMPFEIDESTSRNIEISMP